MWIKWVGSVNIGSEIYLYYNVYELFVLKFMSIQLEIIILHWHKLLE